MNLFDEDFVIGFLIGAIGSLAILTWAEIKTRIENKKRDGDNN